MTVDQFNLDVIAHLSKQATFSPPPPFPLKDKISKKNFEKICFDFLFDKLTLIYQNIFVILSRILLWRLFCVICFQYFLLVLLSRKLQLFVVIHVCNRS